MRGLRLLPIVIPTDGDVGPVAALLSDKALRERAREALEETGTAASRTALRQHLAQAEPEPEFACALLNSLGRLHDAESLGLIARLTQNENPKVRAAAARALAWTGDPVAPEDRSIGRGRRGPGHAARSTGRDLRLLNSMERQHRTSAGRPGGLS